MTPEEMKNLKERLRFVLNASKHGAKTHQVVVTAEQAQGMLDLIEGEEEQQAAARAEADRRWGGG